MGLFDEQFKQVEDLLVQKRSIGEVKEFRVAPYSAWPSESSLILEEATALELGNPGIGSIFLLLWSEEPVTNQDRVLLVGPDLNEIKDSSVPFCQILLVKGSFQDEYECYRMLKDAVYETKLKGFMVRTLPSSQSIWCRVDGNALKNGLSLAHLGAALIRNLKNVEFVSGAEALFITSGKEDLTRLKRTAFNAGRIVGAMMKMNEEHSYDCESCEFWDVCERVEELKAIRKRLVKEQVR